MSVKKPVVVAYGLGVDSTAMLVGMINRGEIPDLILFADVGNEWPESYEYLPVINAWLREHGAPEVQVVRRVGVRTTYNTLEENCLVNETLPSLAFGRKACSQKWKVEPQNKFVSKWGPAKAAWAAGLKVTKLIGYDAGPKDMRRSDIAEDKQYEYRYPLREWGWDRERCIAEIKAAGLPVPRKSACFFCPSTKPEEIDELMEKHPDLAARIVRLEDNAQQHMQCGTVVGKDDEGKPVTCNHSREEHERGIGCGTFKAKIEGLWRKATRKRPGAMAAYIRDKAAEKRRMLPMLQGEVGVECGGCMM